MTDGLSIEHAAGAVTRDAIRANLAAFALTVRTSRMASRDVVAAYIDGLAGAVSLTIVGRQGYKDDVINATIAKLREAIERDLKFLK